MAKRSKTSRSAKSKPFTPIRRLFFKLDLFKPLGKRRLGGKGQERNIDTSPTSPPLLLRNYLAGPSTSTSASPQPPSLPPSSPAARRACIALQNEDAVENVIIITALNSIPFCCHEDLLTMSREKIISVALMLNAKLPAALSIDVSHTRPTSFIRSSIELIVGLRGDVPPAPKAIKSLPEEETRVLAELDEQAAMNRSPPTSPLATRSRPHGVYDSLVSPRLARLEEELEEEEQVPLPSVSPPRPAKKRKISTPNSKEQAANANTGDMNLAFTPTPLPRLLRTQSQNVSVAPAPKRVLRSHSQKLPDEMKNIKIDTTFITTTRPRYRYRNRQEDEEGAYRDEKRARARRSANARAQRKLSEPNRSYRPFLALPLGDRSTSGSASLSSMELSPVPMTPPGKKRKRSVERTDDEREMTAIIGDMNMNGERAGDMDVSGC